MLANKIDRWEAEIGHRLHQHRRLVLVEARLHDAAAPDGAFGTASLRVAVLGSVELSLEPPKGGLVDAGGRFDDRP